MGSYLASHVKICLVVARKNTPRLWNMVSRQLIGSSEIIDVQKSAHKDVGVAKYSLMPEVRCTIRG
jgi:hypothetical protein